ncbi:aminoacyl-tRNA hydrolase [Candidatus Saccharibacteria bacterium]|nr:aminoacyl-tRNA hydrolase [Candidatus Saccharibacteria bacterium]
MKLIVGLGNPGNQYNFTRHNAGFLALDFYAKVKGLSWEPHPKHDALYLKTTDALFIKPQTFYNDSGRSVQAFARFYKIPTSDILVICDDFSLEFGKLRSRIHGSDGGNNGLKSITEQLGTPDFPRLRIGTANDTLRRKLGDTDFVLGRFTEEERATLPSILPEVITRIDQFLG